VSTFELVFYTCAYFFIAFMLMMPVAVEYFDRDSVLGDTPDVDELRERRLWCLAILVWPLSIVALTAWTLVIMVRALVWAVTGK